MILTSVKRQSVFLLLALMMGFLPIAQAVHLSNHDVTVEHVQCSVCQSFAQLDSYIGSPTFANLQCKAVIEPAAYVVSHAVFSDFNFFSPRAPPRNLI